jgi:anti-sigma B factor antagonist
MTLQEIETSLAQTSIPTKLSMMDEVVYIQLRGQIDTNNSHLVVNAFNSIIEAGYTRIILDMASVPYASSTGIGALIHLLKAVSAKKGKLVLINLVPGVFSVIQLLGFTSFLTIKDSVDAALKEM